MPRAGFVLLFGLGMMLKADAQPLADAAPAMARSISSLLPRRAIVSLEFQTRATVDPAGWSSFREAIRDELRKNGTEFREAGQAETRVRITVSADPHGLLLIAEVAGNNNTRQIVLAPWGSPKSGDAKPVLRIEMTPIAELADPILDIWMSDSGLDVFLLTPAKVTAMHLTNGRWMPAGQTSLNIVRPPPRDPRGRLLSIGGSLRVFLPGNTCTSPMGPQLLFACAPGNEPWSLSPGDSASLVHWVSDRNVLEASTIRESFYNGASGWFASSSGTIENGSGEIAAGTETWGSDLVSLESPCGSGSVAIVTTAGDAQHEQVQAFSIATGTPTAVSAALPLPGSVTALWPAERPAHATMVVRNSKTGNYEASRLGLACTE